MAVIKLNDRDKNPAGNGATRRKISQARQLDQHQREYVEFSNIIGRDKKMISVFQQIRDVARFDYPVLISGDTGTGKELVANAIHTVSGRRDRPFIPINCGALPEGLVESELFGHVKGAFSGAVRNKKGRFELGDGGTIFLDEVAELSKFMQVKLLRFLQDGRFEKVGGEETVSVNVRIVCATNKNLKQELKENNFRDDLYYRLNVVPITLPLLADRKHDIPLLVNHFLIQASRQLNLPLLKIKQEALDILIEYNWPGNIRELQNIVQFAIVKSGGKDITPEDLPIEIQSHAAQVKRRGPMRKLNQKTVQTVMAKTGGNKAKAARFLGVGRATLYRFLKSCPDLECNFAQQTK